MDDYELAEGGALHFCANMEGSGQSINNPELENSKSLIPSSLTEGLMSSVINTMISFLLILLQGPLITVSKK